MAKARARPLFDAQAIEMLQTVAVPSRLALVIDLVGCGRERRVSDLAERADVSLSMVSRHLRALEAVGLVESRRAGTEVFYRVPGARLASALRGLADHLERCCP